jgi:G:T-mismatch repair DNA endonuclease (very short patch repair protein)
MKPQLLLLILAFDATIWAAAAFLLNFDGDFVVAAIVALLSLGGVFWLDHTQAERARMAHGRDAVWRRRIEEMDPWERDEYNDLVDEYLREMD